MHDGVKDESGMMKCNIKAATKFNLVVRGNPIINID